MWSGVAYDQLQITNDLRYKTTKDITVFEDSAMKELNKGYVESDNVKQYNGTCFNSYYGAMRLNLILIMTKS